MSKPDGVTFSPKRYRRSKKDLNSVWGRKLFRTKIKHNFYMFRSSITCSSRKLHIENSILLRNNNNNDTILPNTTLFYGKFK